MLENLYIKTFLEKITEYQGKCERLVRNHNDNTNIDKSDKKYLRGCDHNLAGFVCQQIPTDTPFFTSLATL